mgnify:CR=1 FL=1
MHGFLFNSSTIVRECEIERRVNLFFFFQGFTRLEGNIGKIGNFTRNLFSIRRKRGIVFE